MNEIHTEKAIVPKQHQEKLDGGGEEKTKPKQNEIAINKVIKKPHTEQSKIHRKIKSIMKKDIKKKKTNRRVSFSHHTQTKVVTRYINI